MRNLRLPLFASISAPLGFLLLLAGLQACSSEPSTRYEVETTFTIALDSLPDNAPFDSVVVELTIGGGTPERLSFASRPSNDTITFSEVIPQGAEVQIHWTLFAAGSELAQGGGLYQAGSFDAASDSLEAIYVQELVDSLQALVSAPAHSSNANPSSSGAPTYRIAFSPKLLTATESLVAIDLHLALAATSGSQLPEDCSVTLKLRGTRSTGKAADYKLVDSTLTFLTGDQNGSQHTLPLLLRKDSLVEGTETLVFALQESCGNVSLSTDSTLTITLQDSDSLRVARELSSDSLLESGGEFTLTSRLQMPLGTRLQDSLEVEWLLPSGHPLPARVTPQDLRRAFPAGSRDGDTLLWIFPVTDDAAETPDEQVRLAMSLADRLDGQAKPLVEADTAVTALLNDDFGVLFITDSLGQRALALTRTGALLDSIHLDFAPLRIHQVNADQLYIIGASTAAIWTLSTGGTVSKSGSNGSGLYHNQTFYESLTYGVGVSGDGVGGAMMARMADARVNSEHPLLLDMEGGEITALWTRPGSSTFDIVWLRGFDPLEPVDSLALSQFVQSPLGYRLTPGGGDLLLTAYAAGCTAPYSCPVDAELHRIGASGHAALYSSSQLLRGVDSDDTGDLWLVAATYRNLQLGSQDTKDPRLIHLNSTGTELGNIPLIGYGPRDSHSYGDLLFSFLHQRVGYRP
jgi:hypothetical protein